MCQHQEKRGGFYHLPWDSKRRWLATPLQSSMNQEPGDTKTHTGGTRLGKALDHLRDQLHLGPEDGQQSCERHGIGRMVEMFYIWTAWQQQQQQSCTWGSMDWQGKGCCQEEWWPQRLHTLACSQAVLQSVSHCCQQLVRPQTERQGCTNKIMKPTTAAWVGVTLSCSENEILRWGFTRPGSVQ